MSIAGREDEWSSGGNNEDPSPVTMKGQWAQEMMKKKTDKKVLDRDGIVGVCAAGFGAAKFFCRIPALCHRAKHMRGPGVRATKKGGTVAGPAAASSMR